MKRRDFLKWLSASSPLLLGGCALYNHNNFGAFNDEHVDVGDIGAAGIGVGDIAETQNLSHLSAKQISDELLKDDRAKSVYFSQDFADDIFFREQKYEMVQRLVKKFRGVQKLVGYGNFNLLGMDEFFYFAGTSVSVGAITPEEKKFLEELFYFDAKKYGFNGDKVLTKFTAGVKKSDALKVPRSGHYLKRGDSMEIYSKVRKDVGDSLVLTSGLRAIAKQFHLFLEKGIDSKGNMSKASRSLAPPGYSFHGRGDFDVGKIGYGLKNFTQDFASTDEYKRLLDLGYINIRYTESNLLGVRFEPWHIKVEG